jgi:hypothetical protein
MEAIKLNKEQVRKLLEMCNSLFPKNKIWRFDDGLHFGCLEYSIEGNVVKYIHWFEFCLSHLCCKLGNECKNDYFDETELRHEMITRQEWYKNYHPVDFLYEQFKLNK